MSPGRSRGCRLRPARRPRPAPGPELLWRASRDRRGAAWRDTRPRAGGPRSNPWRRSSAGRAGVGRAAAPAVDAVPADSIGRRSTEQVSRCSNSTSSTGSTRSRTGSSSSDSGCWTCCSSRAAQPSGRSRPQPLRNPSVAPAAVSAAHPQRSVLPLTLQLPPHTRCELPCEDGTRGRCAHAWLTDSLITGGHVGLPAVAAERRRRKPSTFRPLEGNPSRACDVRWVSRCQSPDFGPGGHSTTPRNTTVRSHACEH